MKELIVMLAALILGLFLFTLIAGEQDGSIYSNVKQVWRTEIELRRMEDEP